MRMRVVTVLLAVIIGYNMATLCFAEGVDPSDALPLDVDLHNEADTPLNDQLSEQTRETLFKLEQILQKPQNEPSAAINIVNGARSKEISAAPEEAAMMTAPDETFGGDAGLAVAFSDHSQDTLMQSTLEEAYRALQLGQTEVALTLYHKALELAPLNEAAMIALATLYHKEGNVEAARELYVTLLQHNPHHRVALNNFLMLVAEESPHEAIAAFRKLEAINPHLAVIPAQIAMIFARENDPKHAIKYFKKALILEPDNISYRYNLAAILDRMGAKTQAAMLYRQLLEANRNGADLPIPSAAINERLIFITAK
jgi:Flp pilus assembly protein TadD